MMSAGNNILSNLALALRRTMSPVKTKPSEKQQFNEEQKQKGDQQVENNAGQQDKEAESLNNKSLAAPNTSQVGPSDEINSARKENPASRCIVKEESEESLPPLPPTQFGGGKLHSSISQQPNSSSNKPTATTKRRRQSVMVTGVGSENRKTKAALSSSSSPSPFPLAMTPVTAATAAAASRHRHRRRSVAVTSAISATDIHPELTVEKLSIAATQGKPAKLALANKQSSNPLMEEVLEINTMYQPKPSTSSTTGTPVSCTQALWGMRAMIPVL